MFPTGSCFKYLFSAGDTAFASFGRGGLVRVGHQEQAFEDNTHLESSPVLQASQSAAV